MHTLNKLSRVFGTNVKTILCNNPNMTLKIQVRQNITDYIIILTPQHHLVGSSMSGAWINLKNLDSINREELTRVFQIMQVKQGILQDTSFLLVPETEEFSNIWGSELPVQQPGDPAAADLPDDHEQREHHGQPQVLRPAGLL